MYQLAQLIVLKLTSSYLNNAGFDWLIGFSVSAFFVIG